MPFINPEDGYLTVINLFKTDTTKAPSDYEKAERSFHENRERLKSERLIREAELKRRSGAR